MRVAVWDTYVEKKDGDVMHFDILVPDNIDNEALIHDMGKQYLISVNQEGQALNPKQCKFCHIETASPEVEASILKNGFHILEMEGCR